MTSPLEETVGKASRVAGAVDLALLFVGLALLFAAPHHLYGDGQFRFETLERFVATGHLSSDRFSVLVAIVATPLYLIGRALGNASEGAALLNTTLFAGALLFLWRELATEAPRVRGTFILLLLYASMFPHHIHYFYGETLTAVTVTMGVVWLSRGQRVAGWVAIVVGAVNTPAALVGVVTIAVCDFRRDDQRLRFLALLGPVAALAFTRLEGFLVRGGSLLTTGYESDHGVRTVLPYSGLPGFSYPFVFGVLAIVLSFGKGLLFYTPGLFIKPAAGTSARLAWIHRTLVAFVVGLVLVYARWWAWYGGDFWGPRFFLIASVPACLGLATLAASPPSSQPLTSRAWVVVAFAFSFWVGVDGFLFAQNGLGVCIENNYALEFLMHFVPEMSALFHPFVDFAASVNDQSRTFVYCMFVLWAFACAWTGRHLIGRLLANGQFESLKLRRNLMEAKALEASNREDH